VVGGQYEVLSVLGSGGMSDVYTCEDKVLKRTVAVKVMRATGVTNAQLLRRFQTEGKAIAKIRHDNIIDIYGLHTDGGIPFLVMEYLSGEPLSKLIAHEKQLTVQRTLNIAAQICDGLASAHQQGVIHRDLKPSNIIVMNRGTMREKVKILDFGIAKIKEESGKTLTKTGDIFGTPQYMSPEQAQGKDCDARSDQYSLGCMIYEMLAGKPPFSGDNHLATMMAHLNEKPVPLSKVSRLVPPNVVAAVEVMLAKEPENRFATISDARAALFGSTLPKASLKKWLAMGAVVVCMAVATAVCIGYLNKPGESNPANLGSLRDAAPTVQTTAARERRADLEFKRWCRAHPQAISFDNKDDPLCRRELSDAALVDLTQMVPNLRSMNLSGCALVTNKGLHDLAGLQLSKLDLSGTDIKDDSLKALASMTSLRELNLGNTDVGDKACSSLVGLTDLQTLFLGHTKISQSGVADLSKIRSLNVLFLDTCAIPGAIASLQNLNLCYLNLSNA
jgi:tRNA A-37 threonylcarbamoyl transferase component Bud32